MRQLFRRVFVLLSNCLLTFTLAVFVAGQERVLDVHLKSPIVSSIFSIDDTGCSWNLFGTSKVFGCSIVKGPLHPNHWQSNFIPGSPNTWQNSAFAYHDGIMLTQLSPGVSVTKSWAPVFGMKHRFMVTISIILTALVHGNRIGRFLIFLTSHMMPIGRLFHYAETPPPTGQHNRL